MKRLWRWVHALVGHPWTQAHTHESGKVITWECSRCAYVRWFGRMYDDEEPNWYLLEQPL